MTFPVLVIPCNGKFSATLSGAPDIRAVAPTREEAVAALEATIRERVAHGELLALEVTGLGVSGLAGKYRDDPTLREICETAYRERDAEHVE
jgi:hypothetical protein